MMSVRQSENDVCMKFSKQFNNAINIILSECDQIRSLADLFFSLFARVRSGKHFPCFYAVIETCVGGLGQLEIISGQTSPNDELFPTTREHGEISFGNKKTKENFSREYGNTDSPLEDLLWLENQSPPLAKK